MDRRRPPVELHGGPRGRRNKVDAKKEGRPLTPRAHPLIHVMSVVAGAGLAALSRPMGGRGILER
jgi:hypothetical protein